MHGSGRPIVTTCDSTDTCAAADSCSPWQSSAGALSPRPTPQAAPADRAGGPAPSGFRLTVLGTTDLHGNVFNWDYFKNASTTTAAHNDIGVAKVATLVKAVRAERGGERAAHPRRGRHHPGHAAGLLLRQDRPDHRAAQMHPMAAAMNAIGYDAAALGNHEFNYGIDTPAHLRGAVRLPAARRQRGGLRTPAQPAFPPYVIKTVKLHGGKHGQGRHPRPDQPRASRSGTRPTSRARCASPAWSSRRRSGAAAEAAGADVVIVSRALRATRLVLVRRRAAVPRERRPRWSPSRCRASTRSWSATRTSRSRSATSPTRRPASRCCCRAALLGHAAVA